MLHKDGEKRPTPPLVTFRPPQGYSPPFHTGKEGLGHRGF